VSPELDLGIAFTDAYLVLDFVRIDLLRAGDADLSRPVAGPHFVGRRDEDATLEPTANGEEESASVTIVFRATGEAPVRIQAASIDRDEEAGRRKQPLVFVAERCGILHQLVEFSTN